MKGSIEEQLVILTKQTIDCFLKTEAPADAMALYTFYYYTAKWQETNQPKCTTAYTSKALHWSEAKVRKIKKILNDAGLIEDIQEKDKDGKISGHYIKLNYVIKQSTLKETHTVENPQCGTSDTVENRETNALSANSVNALSSGNSNALSSGNKIYSAITDYLNEKAGTNYRTGSRTTQMLIHARMAEGFTLEDFKKVIDNKVTDWRGTEWEKFLRPQTLFGTKFESYLNAKTKSTQPKDTSLDEIF